jgi:hypothetical protein
MSVLGLNEAHCGAGRSQNHRQQDMNTSYSDFLLTDPPLFSRAKDPLEADDWLRTTESKFSLRHCTEYHKTLYAAQQPRGPPGACVTLAFYKNKNFANIEVHIGCISMYPAYKNLSKNNLA